MEKALSINPWIEIWRNPQKTIRMILARNPRFGFPILAGIYGLPIMFHALQSMSTASSLSLFFNVILALLSCVPVGYAGIYIVGFFIYWIGKFEGKATMEELRIAIAWSNIPGLLTILVWVFWMCIFGNSVFRVTFIEGPIFMKNPHAFYQWGWVYFFFFVQCAAAIWSFILLVITVAEVQQFSRTKAVLNIIVAALVLMVICAILATVF